MEGTLDNMHRAFTKEALKRSGGRRKEAADMLGVAERTLYNKVKLYGLGTTETCEVLGIIRFKN